MLTTLRYTATGIALALALALAACSSDPKVLPQLRPGNQPAAAAVRGEAGPADLSRYMEGVADSARIVYAASDGPTVQIFSVQPDGERSIQLTTDDKYKCRPVWSLDHKRIAFFRYAGQRPLGEFVDLVVMNANGSEPHDVKTRLKINVENTRPSWNLAGTVLFVQEKDFPSVLFGYAVDNGQQVDTVRLPRTTFLNQAHTLSPDSRWIAGAGPQPGTGLLHIGTVRRADGVNLDLMKPFAKSPMQVGTVVWSYDSQYVAFELSTVIIVMSSYFRPGFQVHPLTPMETNAELSDPAFSPSGKRLACILAKSKETQLGAGEKDVRSDIWIMNADGKDARQITHSGTCFDPHW
jgi:Tol biopolymer transport system component